MSNQEINTQLLAALRPILAALEVEPVNASLADELRAAIAAAEQQQDCFSNNPPSHEPVVTRSFDEWFLGEQGKPYDSMYVFAKAAWNAATPQPAVPDGWVKLAEDLIGYQDLVNRIGASCEFEGQGMIYASCLDEWADQARAMLAAAKGGAV